MAGAAQAANTSGGGAAGAGTILGMNPLLAMGLLSFAPALLSKLGIFKDPQAEYRKHVGKLLAQQPALAQKYYQQALGSPAYSQAQGTIAAGANATGGQLQSELGARGIGTTGTGAILSSLIPSIVGQQQSGLRTSAYNSGQSQAQNEIQQRIAALGGAPGFGPSSGQQLFAGGLEAFLPYLMQRFGNPGMMGQQGSGQFGGTGNVYRQTNTMQSQPMVP